MNQGVDGSNHQATWRARAVAGLLATLAIAGLLGEADERVLAAVFAGALLLLALGLMLRWRHARIAALLVFSLTAAFGVLGVAWNVFILFAISPLGPHDFVRLGVALLVTAAVVAAALWLQGLQAKEFYRPRETR